MRHLSLYEACLMQHVTCYCFGGDWCWSIFTACMQCDCVTFEASNKSINQKMNCLRLLMWKETAQGLINTLPCKLSRQCKGN